jgi:Ion channel
VSQTAAPKKKPYPNKILAGVIAGEIAVTVFIVSYMQAWFNDTETLSTALTCIGLMTLGVVLAMFSVIYIGPGLRSMLLLGGVFLTSVGCIITLFGKSYSMLGLKHTIGVQVDACGPVPVNLSEAVYFSVVTWTTVGYGDLAPCGRTRLVANVEALVGYLVMALLIAALVEGTQKVRQSGEQKRA